MSRGLACRCRKAPPHAQPCFTLLQTAGARLLWAVQDVSSSSARCMALRRLHSHATPHLSLGIYTQDAKQVLVLARSAPGSHAVALAQPAATQRIRLRLTKHNFRPALSDKQYTGSCLFSTGHVICVRTGMRRHLGLLLCCVARRGCIGRVGDAHAHAGRQQLRVMRKWTCLHVCSAMMNASLQVNAFGMHGRWDAIPSSIPKREPELHAYLLTCA